MLNKFTYQLELNNLNQCTTKSNLKAKITKYNSESFYINNGARIEIYIPWYTDIEKKEEMESIILYFSLLQLAITKYAELYDITDLPQYVQYLNKFKINITLKE